MSNIREIYRSDRGKASCFIEVAAVIVLVLALAFLPAGVLHGEELISADALIESDTAQAEGDDDAFKDLEASRAVNEKTAGPSADVSEVAMSQEEMIWYVRGISGKLENIRLYSGMEQIPVSEAGLLGEEGGPAPKTLILIDNSNSVAHAFPDGPDRINAILTRLIWNHQIGERFAIKTFNEQTQTVLDYTDNYDELRLKLENIIYQDQDTYLRNVLFEQIHALMNDGEDAYKRIVLVSDGTDDSRLGVTYEELTDLINREDFFLPIYTVAPDYLPAESELDKLFALSRRTDTPYYFLPSYDVPTDVADGIVADGHRIAYFRIPIPVEYRTGEFRGFTLSVTDPDGTYTLNHTLMMPPSRENEIAQVQSEKARLAQEEKEAARAYSQSETEAERARQEEMAQLTSRVDELEKNGGAAQTLSDLEERIKALENQNVVRESEEERQKEEAALGGADAADPNEMETEVYGVRSDLMEEMLVENRDYFFVRSIRSVIWVVMGIILLMLIGYVIYGDRTRKNRREFEELSDSEQRQELPPDLTKPLTKGVILYDPVQPQIRYSIGIGQDQVIGRLRTRCDIAFPLDHFMAGRQARIFFRDGKVFVENLDSGDTLKLDDVPVQGTRELANGARLTLGMTKLTVQYE